LNFIEANKNTLPGIGNEIYYFCTKDCVEKFKFKYKVKCSGINCSSHIYPEEGIYYQNKIYCSDNCINKEEDQIMKK